MAALRKPYPYWINQKLRFVFSRAAALVAPAAEDADLNIHAEPIEKILLVRANFRMGSAVLATPAIFQFRRNFPRARIDFVGSPMSATLFKHLPLDHHYQITRRFPNASWAYLALLKSLRRTRYDMAVELSVGASSMGAFIVGFSGARFRVGSQGKRDSWFNVKVPKTTEKNKYRSLPAFTKAIGLSDTPASSSLTLTKAETAEGKRRIDDITAGEHVVGVFIGGRDRWHKRWPIENFLKLTDVLHARGVGLLVFAGPDEQKLLQSLRQRMHPAVPLVFEPSVRIFAAMITHCRLFITSDTGPMHLACALGVRTLAIFQTRTFQRWGPPAGSARILFQSGGVSPEEVVEACMAELSGHQAAPDPLAVD